MKTILTLIILNLTIHLFAQNYIPFNDSTSKRFFSTVNQTDNNYFIHIDSSTISGDTINFYQYKESVYDPSFNTTACSFWDGTNGYYLDTTWLGIQILWNSSSQELTLKNSSFDTLNFNFNPNFGGSSIFYSDGAINYSIEYIATNWESFYGISDSVRVYEIQATDLGGLPVNSTLNNFEIRLSKNYGLITFINCFDFPNVEQGMQLQGQSNPSFGNYQLTYDEAYPWQIGDILQFENSRNGPQGNATNYQTLAIINRTETADSVWITLSSTDYLAPVGYSQNTGPIIFKKGSFISPEPWNKAIYSDSPYSPSSFKSEDPFIFCQDSLRTLTTSQATNHFCEPCQCFGGYDASGTSNNSSSNAIYSEKYGIAYKSSLGYGYPTFNNYYLSSLVYSNINGVECGTLWNDLDELKIDISIAPNPSKDLVKINADQLIETIKIRDLSARLMFEQTKIASKSTEISLASFQKGAYILEIQFENAIQTRTIIRE